ncbi:uncharacterized protein F4822DRAFT_425398 [Hypoxylon trugodes]|uniref:uncharacterized protein n=1 Tax=Hypoxylon trugodes TaxID=326681 RepID=UPI0021962D94|nr:uncharacterized protein F4822DRAFT_425398 [Hypoxylon trugodes]KAI1392187.1 hypothetical protein F4822DRAFT_425398 [Hypoxylon trugodes]
MASRQPPPPSSKTRPPRRIRRGAAPLGPNTVTNPNTLSSSSRGGFSPRKLVWTGAFAAITIVGAIYGAGLKTQQEFKQEKQQIIESTPEDRIRDLETRRAMLVKQKMPLERKLVALRERMKAQELEAAAAAEGSSGVEGGKK